ncbi:MAG: hypothetical protein H6883_05400 [Rhodobiaceae bacterium]|nr:hypothetical protein [Rhodobiaceae bacterium]
MTRRSKDRPTDPRPAREEEARAALRRIAAETETIGTSQLARLGNRARDHFITPGSEDDDAVEIWGKRIARGLALIVLIGLIYHLYTTYVAA